MKPRASRGAPVRIGLDAGLACSRRPTGVEYFARALLVELLGLEAPRIEWHVYLPPSARDDPAISADRARLHFRPEAPVPIADPWLAARSWVDRLRVLYSFGHLLPPGGRGRLVGTVHDTAFDQFPDCYPPGAAARAHAQVASLSRRAARIVVPSSATRLGVTRGYGFPEERVDVIYEASRSCFRPGPSGPYPRSVAGAGIEPPYLLTVGRLDRRKNGARVIEAYRRVLREGTACGGLVIAGPDDSGSEQVRRELAENQVPGERIVLTGYLEEQELVALYRGAAALVFPSFAEGFGLPVLEAMACGTPVITSSVSALAEVAGSAALLVPPDDTAALADRMREVLSDSAVAARLRESGLRRAAEFSWSGSAQRLLAALERAAGVGPGPVRSAALEGSRLSQEAGVQ